MSEAFVRSRSYLNLCERCYLHHIHILLKPILITAVMKLTYDILFSLLFGRVDVSVTRLGGAFGGKIKNSRLVAAAVAVVANKLNRY